MPWWLLLLALIFVWILVPCAEALSKFADARRRGVPSGTPRGSVSLMPALLLPFMFFFIALGVDLIVGPWGTRIVLALNAAIGLICLAHIIWSALCLVKNRAVA